MNIRVSTYSLSAGVIIPIMAPRKTSAASFRRAIQDQAARLARISGVSGVAVNVSAFQRTTLTLSERLAVVQETRKGLLDHQVLWADIGVLSNSALMEAKQAKIAGAGAVIAKLPALRNAIALEEQSLQTLTLSNLAKQIELPIVLSLSGFGRQADVHLASAVSIAKASKQIFGFELDHSDNVLSYDRYYYALKTLDRPLAVLTSSDTALYHNLNTGSDGVVSDLAYIAPHEVCDLFKANQAGAFFEAQAIHNKLAPLIRLLEVNTPRAKEAIVRHLAYERGLLAATEDQMSFSSLDKCTVRKIHAILDDVQLRPICWV